MRNQEINWEHFREYEYLDQDWMRQIPDYASVGDIVSKYLTHKDCSQIYGYKECLRGLKKPIKPLTDKEIRLKRAELEAKAKTSCAAEIGLLMVGTYFFHGRKWTYRDGSSDQQPEMHWFIRSWVIHETRTARLDNDFQRWQEVVQYQVPSALHQLEREVKKIMRRENGEL